MAAVVCAAVCYGFCAAGEQCEWMYGLDESVTEKYVEMKMKAGGPGGSKSFAAGGM